MDAAAPYVRILVRVPEAYLLIYHYEAVRPGLLVLDADGRWVGALNLRGVTEPAAVARWLGKSVRAPAVEQFELRFVGQEDKAVGAFREKLLRIKGVEKAPRTPSMSRGDRSPAVRTLAVRAPAGALHPRRVEALAAAVGLEMTLVSPVRVNLQPAGPEAAHGRPPPGTAGVWYVAADPPPRVYSSQVLLDPGALARANPGFTADLATYAFEFSSLSKGGRGAGVAMAPLRLTGVLAVFPDIFGDAERVVVRPGKVTPRAILDAFEKAGGKARLADS